MTQFHVAQTQKKIPVLYLFSLIVLLGNLFRNKIKILDKKTQITRSPGNLHQFVKLKPTNLFARHVLSNQSKPYNSLTENLTDLFVSEYKIYVRNPSDKCHISIFYFGYLW